MEINQTFAGVAASPAPAPAISATSQLSSDFEVFLRMLTAQMQYQDPLNPIDSTDYATQLATFSGVEQSVQTNDLLRTLTSQLGVGGLSGMATWVGKEVRFTGPVAFDGQPMTLYPLSTAGAETWEISVRNANGEEVQNIPVPPGASEVNWSGLQYGGQTAPEGIYSFIAIGRTNGQIVGETVVEAYAKVTEARLEGGQQMLILQGGAKVAFESVTAVRQG